MPWPATIMKEYAAQYGTGALAVPPNQGGMRGIYAIPAAAVLGGAALVFTVLRKWKRRGDDADAAAKAGHDAGAKDEYDERLDAELKRLDE